MPVFNDWESVKRLLPRIAEQLQVANAHADVLLVDDGSKERPPSDWGDGINEHLRTVRIVRLYRNVGHQRAICMALCFLRTESDWRVSLLWMPTGRMIQSTYLAC